MLQRIIAPGAPSPKGPYSHAVRCGDFVFVSGQGPIDPATNQWKLGDVGSETRATLENIRAILRASGADLEDVVKCSVFLTDIKDFAAMNQVYSEFFGNIRPARTTVQATLPGRDTKVEIDCIAYKPAAK
ncbi:MAG TPA: Rid family detoxifying hydrolase [Bryobacterales bacterium]|nr:Rid family detoxifying hydrolase [Bryobacterales bacterium]